MQDKVSIITPSWNSEKYIEKNNRVCSEADIHELGNDSCRRLLN